LIDQINQQEEEVLRSSNSTKKWFDGHDQYSENNEYEEFLHDC